MARVCMRRLHDYAKWLLREMLVEWGYSGRLENQPEKHNVLFGKWSIHQDTRDFTLQSHLSWSSKDRGVIKESFAKCEIDEGAQIMNSLTAMYSPSSVPNFVTKFLPHRDRHIAQLYTPSTR